MNKDKIYYTMGEVAEMFGLNISTVRYWDNEFSLLKLERNKKGNRLFRQDDIKKFQLIYHLIKEKGMTIKGAKQYIEQRKLSSAEKDMEVIERLEGIKSLLKEVIVRMNEDKHSSQVIFESTED